MTHKRTENLTLCNYEAIYILGSYLCHLTTQQVYSQLLAKNKDDKQVSWMLNHCGQTVQKASGLSVKTGGRNDFFLPARLLPKKEADSLQRKFRGANPQAL